MYNKLETLLCQITTGPLFNKQTYTPVCINKWETSNIDIESIKELEGFISAQKTGNQIGTGGYLEPRNIYHRGISVGDYQNTDGELREIHLALDFWTDAGTPVLCPLDGVIHSTAYIPTVGQFGGCVVVQHCIKGHVFHTLYGHLSEISASTLRAGMSIEKGQILGYLGTPEQNGFWPPHLHFQIIQDMQGFKGDYFGVAFPSQLDFFAQNCPDPNLLLKIDCLIQIQSII